MGEAKQRRLLGASDVREVATEITKRLSDEGKLIEAGWVAFRRLVIAKDAPDIQVREMRLAFFAGAEHLFSSIMVSLDEGAEPTETDLARMTNLNNELEQFRQQFAAAHVKTKGSA